MIIRKRRRAFTFSILAVYIAALWATGPTTAAPCRTWPIAVCKCMYGSVARVVYSRFFPDWTKPQTGRLNKSPHTIDSIANRFRAQGGQNGRSASQLENTYWKLVELNGKPVTAASRRREPHLRLSLEAKTLQGSGGCNTMRGGYQLNGDRLRFTQIATTRMACPDPYMSQEREFLKALEDTDSFKLSGDKLELHGGGKSLARFEARQAPGRK